MSVQPILPTKPVTFDPVKEVRFAVVIYGGVSLATYIHGIVQEMLRFVRATAPAEDLRSEQALHEQSELISSERVYRQLGQILNDPDSEPTELLSEVEHGVPKPIRTRFVIDILSGTSAGGINAIFLAKALANNHRLDAVKDLWLSQGDIQELINDDKSLKGQSLKRRLIEQDPPQSLLNSNRLYLELLNALDGMDTRGCAQQCSSSRSPLVDELDLFSTTTDINGLTVPLSLTDKVVHERRHKCVFHFRYLADDQKESAGATPTRNDFDKENNPFLAFVARCTSAFPFAFEPMQLADIFPIVRTADLHARSRYCNPTTDHWERLYDNYLRADQSGPRSQPFHLRSFGDGGYLDNKPFSSAIDTILTRPSAALTVERKLVYIEPNPEGLSARRDDAMRPNAVENSLAALLFLPRYETIRDDLERVVKRNLEIERVERIVTDVHNLLYDSDNRIEHKANGQNPYECSSGYASYQRLRVSAVTDELANRLSRAYRVNPNGAFGKAVRTLASVWRERRYGDAENRDNNIRNQKRFLLELDVEYRLRRIRYLHRCIQDEYQELKYARHLADKGVPVDAKAYRQALRRIRGALGPSYAALQGLLRNLIVPNGLPEKVFTTEHMDLVAEPPEEPDRWEKLETHPRAMEPSEHGARQRAEYVLDERRCMPVMNELAKAVVARFGPVLKKADNFIDDAWGEDDFQTPAARAACAFVRKYWQKFEFYDSITFPINFGTNVDGFGPVSIHRISPDDTKARDDALQGHTKLRGQALGSFGGFFDRRWRRNDMLWGRLDGAERLITMVLPKRDLASTELRNKLVDGAHKEIVSEFLGLDADRRALWKQELRAYVADLPEQPDRQLVATSAARCVAVTGRLLEGISDGYAARAKPLFARMALIGRLMWNFIEVSMPHTFGELVGNHWMRLLVLFVAMLGVLALITASALPLALPVAFGVLVLSFLRRRLRRYLRGDELFVPAEISALTVLVTVGLAGLIIYLVGIPWPSDWGYLRRPEVDPDALGIGDPRDYQWSFVLLGCTLFITVLSGVWRRKVVHRARSFNRQLDVIGKLKSSRRWQDVAEALGLSSQTQSGTVGDSATSEAKNDDRSALRAAARAAVVRASTHHGAVIRALGADHVFTTACALALVAMALCIFSTGPGLWEGSARTAIRYGVLGLCALGILAAAANMVVDGRILRVLRETLPENGEELLRAPPHPYNIAKWLTMAMAVAVVIGWVSGVLWEMRHGGR